MKCGPRGVVAVVGVLALVAGSVLAQGFARLEVFPSNGCSGTPEVVDLTLDGCTEFAWTDPDAEINSLQLTQLMCGDTLSVVSVRGYAGAGCTDENTLFFSRTIFGGTIQPSECSEVATGSGLPVIKVASYVCDGDPTPAPISSPTPSPSPTAAPSPSPTPTPTPIESSTTTPSPTPSPSPSPTNSPDPVPTPTPVCIDAEWIEARGLEKVHASDGMGDLLCITGLPELPCGTPGHVLEVSIETDALMRTGNTALRTFAEVCSERDCSLKVGRFNGVLHSDADRLPIQDGLRLTTVAHRGTVWSSIENQIVVGAQKLGSQHINRALAYLQRRNSA
ncbi:hypothetical protein FVE85_2061 [Porphyridium purpureum]|uniref:Uncharacterized protein n=1 Tax=Porphyridium purpureum TaxID=35688 RepID=A0A5J4YX41_PORPP|nr:hypothetical protein FVE85_2061 [Porphyridium purpureum]|eukprot:POR6367..scf209_3